MPDLVVREEAEQSVSLIHPQTGEILDLAAAENAQIASWIESVKEWEVNARGAKQLASEEIHRRMDRAACWTLRDGDYEIKGQSPDRTEYLIDSLQVALRNLIAEGLITEEAAQAAVKREVTYKPAKRGINALLKIGGEVAEAIRACEVPDERPRRVSIGRRA